MSACRFPSRVSVISALIVLSAARAATADPVVIYSNFGPSPGYGSQVWSSSEENGYFMGFQLNEAARLSSVTVPMAWRGNLPADFSVWVFASSGGAPGATIEQMVIPFPADAPPDTFMMLALSSALQPTLSANTLYFLFASPSKITGPGFTFSSLWPWNNGGIQGSVARISPAGAFITQGTLGAFQLTGELAPTPEPTSMVLVASGIAGLFARRRWKS